MIYTEEVIGLRSEEFLKLFRVLESLLEKKYAGSRRSSASVVMQYGADAESIPVRDELTLCREVRNILTHSAEIGGETILEPAQGLIDMLHRIIEYAKRPPLALEFATGSEQLLWADLNQRALEIMRAMEKRGFSHVPVLQKGELLGVFSMSTVFNYCIKDEGNVPITTHTRIREFANRLPIDHHSGECYIFMDEKATYADVKTAFERIKMGDKRLAAIFITKTGKSKEPLLGMITPWDVLGKRERLPDYQEETE